MENKNTYNIKAVSMLTGLSEHTIRAWERRYSAVTPERTETNRRLYSEQDIKKLTLLSKAVNLGYTISNIANYEIENLNEILNKQTADQKSENIVVDDSFNEVIEKCIFFIKDFDRSSLEKILIRSSVEYSKQKMLIEFIIPLLERIGILWQTGKIRVIHEHFAASVLRTFLGNLIESTSISKEAPKIITTTPEGFLHELGALIASLYVIDFGWNPIFLGPSLPAEEISAAAKENQTSAVLSLVYPYDDPHAGNQLRKLRKYMGENFPIILTGNSASSYIKYINETGSILVKKLDELHLELSNIRINN